MVTTVESLWAGSPAVTPLAGGITEHAEVQDDIAWSTPTLTGLGISYNCIKNHVPSTMCGATTTKTFDNPSLVAGFEFAGYVGVKCKPFGGSIEEEQAEAERLFNLSEDRIIERSLMTTRFIQGPDDDPTAGTAFRWPAASDITPGGTAVSAKAGVAILEGFAASSYAGVPTLHLPYTVGALLANEKNIESQGGKFYTGLGSKVVVGAGYEYPQNGPAGTAPAAGERWLFATGEVRIGRSKLIRLSEMDRSTNDIYAIAERRYVAAVDCFVAAIRVKVE